MNEPVSKPVRISLAPAWILGITAVIRLLLIIVSVISVQRLRNGGLHITNRSFFINGMFIIVLVAEAIIYWRIRKKIYRKGWVFSHLVLMLIPMIVVPLLFAVLPRLLDTIPESNNMAAIIRNVSKVSFYLSWCCLLAGNIFFVATVAKSFQFKNIEQDDTGLVDI